MSWELRRGEALAVLAELETASVDAVITDPPYSSGGQYRGDRTRATGVKYSQSKTPRPNFSGDNRDQRSFAYWCTLWLTEARRVTRPEGTFAIFTDWRQLPTITDVVQAGGWVWRGIFTWHKTVARPTRGGFKQNSEFVVWGTNGGRGTPHEVYLPGVVTAAPVPARSRRHLTEKPLAVMETLVQVAPPGGLVLDPFAGAASTGVAALRQGRRFLGVELDPDYAEVARARLREEVLG